MVARAKKTPEYLLKTISLSIYLSLPLAVVSGFALTPLNIVLAVAACIYFFKGKFSIPFSDSILLTFSAFFIWALLSSTWSIEPYASFKYWLRVFLIVLSAVVLFVIAGRINKKDSWVRIFLPAFAIGVLLMAYEYYTKLSITTFFRSLLSSGETGELILDNMNKSACFLALLTWPVICSVFFGVKDKAKRISTIILLLLASFFMIVKLESVSAQISFLCAAMTFFFVLMTKKRFNWLIPLSVILVSLVIPFAAKKMEPYELLERYPHIPDSGAHRLFIWNFAADKASEKPILGWGFKASRYVPDGRNKVTVDGALYKRELLPSHPHNGILQIWLELGLVGLLIFLWCVWTSFHQINEKNKKPLVNATFHALLINYIVIDMLSFDIMRIWWLSTGIIAVFFMLLVTNQAERKSW